jgi:hypothetical protein
VNGTLLNAAAILAGALYVMLGGRQLAGSSQQWWRLVLGAATVFVGIRLVWLNLNGPPIQILKQLGLLLAGLVVGRLLGRLLGCQRFSNQLGRYASQRLEAACAKGAGNASEGFVVCAILYCLAPLAILGALPNGLKGTWEVLAVKAVMDGLAAMSFAQTYRGGVVLAALPVLAWQGTLTLAARLAEPWLAAHQLVEPIAAAAGLLVAFVSLIIFEVVRLEIADYLPTLVVVPVLFWLAG